MAIPLLPLIGTVAPYLVRWLFDKDIEHPAAKAAVIAVQSITGTADPAQAAAVLESDSAKRAELQMTLARIAAEQEQAQRAAELEQFKALLADRGSARSQTIELAKAGSPIAWGAPLVSFIVLGAFAVVLWWVVARGMQANENATLMLGALTTMASAVVSYWVGSSSGSKAKDERLGAVAEEAVRRSASPPTFPGQAGLKEAAPAASNFAACCAVVLGKEGGFVEHPDDPGGPTNRGITQVVLAEWRRRPVTRAEVEALSEAEAMEIYRSRYWNAVQGDRLPRGLDLMVFDFCVNAGPARASRFLQDLAGATPDGVIGPKTLDAVGKLNVTKTIRQYAERRRSYYQSLDTFPTFGKGWLRRTDEVEASSLAMAETT